MNPEVSAGTGLSKTRGVAGFPNGEIYRVDTSDPKFNLSRLYLNQDFGLGGESERLESDQNQLAQIKDSDRITVVAGKFSLNDFFDQNTYSHDPRTQFLNWALMDNGAWDYAADTRGYTVGAMLEYHRSKWAVRFGSVAVPKFANQIDLEYQISTARSDNLEFEYHYQFRGHPGISRILAYENHAHMGNYRTTLNTPGDNLDVTLSRTNSVKYGFGFNAEQEFSADLGSFMRLGWNDGATETWAFTEIDRTLTAGAVLKGSAWRRNQDTVGIAAIINGLSKDHANYLEAGGYGFLVGDGKLNYGPEEILETYYSFQAWKQGWISADYQFVNHPGYNSDRGPVSIFSGRLHYAL